MKSMAGSINLANVALGFDASQITKGVDLTAGEMRKLNGIFQGSVSEVDRYTAAVTILDKSRATGAFTADRLVQIEASLAKKYGIETEAIRAANKAAADLAQSQRDQIARQKQLDSELQIGIALRKQVATADERMANTWLVPCIGVVDSPLGPGLMRR